MRGRLSEAKLKSMYRGIPRCDGCSGILSRTRIERGETRCAECAGATVPCERCQGSGEVVTDWIRYRHPLPGDKGDEAVADCPDCDGRGEHAEG